MKQAGWAPKISERQGCVVPGPQPPSWPDSDSSPTIRSGPVGKLCLEPLTAGFYGN